MATFPMLQQAGKAAVTASLCAVLTVGPVFAATPAAEDPGTKPTPTPTAALKLTPDQKVLHALNRLTFGPRPGDVAAVEKMGLNAWFERQLNPQSIPDPAMDAIMAKFPAMQLSQAQLVQRFPNPGTLRQMARQGAALPTDPTEHAIYADSMANYDAVLKAAGVTPGPNAPGKKKAAAAAGNNMEPAMAGSASADNDMGGDMAMTTPAAAAKPANANAKGKARAERVAYDGPAVDTILAMPPDERMAAVIAMSPEQEQAFRRQLGQNRSRAFFEGLSPAQLEVIGAMQAPIRVVGAEVLQSRVMRDVFSDRQLEAVMTDFWLNHFNVYVKKNQNEAFLLPAYERDTIRPHALGKFEDLLVATAKSPAMLMYLDNWQSIGPDSPRRQPRQARAAVCRRQPQPPRYPADRADHAQGHQRKLRPRDHRAAHYRRRMRGFCGQDHQHAAHVLRPRLHPG